MGYVSWISQTWISWVERLPDGWQVLLNVSEFVEFGSILIQTQATEKPVFRMPIISDTEIRPYGKIWAATITLKYTYCDIFHMDICMIWRHLSYVSRSKKENILERFLVCTAAVRVCMHTRVILLVSSHV